MTRLRRAIRRRIRPHTRRFKDAATYWLALAAIWVPRQLSLPRALVLADRVGDLLYFVLYGTRRLALSHIAQALGDSLSEGAQRAVVRESFRNVARCLVELAKFDEIRPRFDEYASSEGWEHAEAVLGRGTGGIVVTGHIGNWELLAAYFALKGVPIAAVARRINHPRLNQLMIDFRAAYGVRTIVRESPSASREILTILKSRGVLALVIDQDASGTPSVSVPFLGRPARTPIAAGALAVRRDIPIVPAFARRRPQGGLHFTLGEPLYPVHSGDRRADTTAMTRRCNEVLEQRIRENPAEWVWWHQRWRRKPVPRLDLDGDIPTESASCAGSSLG